MLARASIDKGQTDKARVFVARGLEVNPDNTELQALEASLAATPATSAGDTETPGRGGVQGESPAELFDRVKRMFTN